MNIKIKNVLEALINEGFEAYIVGGFVRDYLLGIESYDVDITTNAQPKDVRRIFDLNSIQENYGSTCFKDSLYNYEITTYRKEIEYSNRRPVKFEYISDIKEDIIRRDFTINSLYMDINGKIYDIVGGQKDLENKIIRSIGNLHDKMTEDPLRMLRAIRFSSLLDFQVDKEILDFIKRNKQLLNTLSSTRKKEELDKIFNNENRLKGIELIKELGITKELDITIPEKIKDCNNYLGIWAQLEVGNSYTFTNNEKRTINDIQKVISYGIIDNVVLYECGLYVCTIASDILDFSRIELSDMYKNLPIYSSKDIKITGDDIMKTLGLEPGEKIKQILIDIEINILEGNIENDHDKLIEYIKSNWW